MSATTRMTRALGVLAAFGLAASLPADELRLKDGRVLVGEVEEGDDGTLTIRTRTGMERIRVAEIASRRTTQELRRALRRAAKGQKRTLHAQLELARIALSYGLEREMWTHLDRAQEAREKAKDRASAGASQRLDAFLATLEPEVLPDGRQLQGPAQRVSALVSKHRAGRGKAFRAALIALLAAEPDADVALRKQARRALLISQRAAAVAALGRRRGTINDRFVSRTAILDRDGAVRTAAIEVLRRYGDARAAVDYLALGLVHDAPVIRIRTAKAFAGLGEASALPLLVAAGPFAGVPRRAAGNIGVRAHMSKLSQQAYIRDFDVEIAQAAAVANPVIGTLQSGVVLDAKIAGVTEQQVQIAMSYRRALRTLTASDPGPDPMEWGDWLLSLDPEAGVRSLGGLKR